jgi:signal transduction histidine kinase
MEAREAAAEHARASRSDTRPGTRTATRTAKPSAEARARIDLLWLETLAKVASRAAHEVKGALNGVSVNLEVVRSRAAKPDAPASAVRRYAESAGEQLEALIKMNDALLLLARRPRDPADVVATLGRLAVLLAPSTAAEGGSLGVEGVGAEDRPTTTAPGNAARLAIAAALLAAVEHKAAATCAVVGGAELALRVECPAAPALVVPAEIVQAVAEAGIRVEPSASAVTLVFPRPGDAGGAARHEG